MKIFDVKRPNKKADLSMSMNAIVVLILAITLLGLGLTFLRGLFQNITEKVDTNLDATQTRVNVDNDKPIGVAPKELELEVGKSDTQTLAFLNTVSGTIGYELEIRDMMDQLCEPNENCDDVMITYNKYPVSINKDKIAEWTITYTIDEEDAGGTVKQFLLSVNCAEDEDDVLGDKCDRTQFQTTSILKINP